LVLLTAQGIERTHFAPGSFDLEPGVFTLVDDSDFKMRPTLTFFCPAIRGMFGRGPEE
jgi:hypothetical protein